MKTTKEKKNKQLNSIETQKIYAFYELEELGKKVKKGNEKITVLYQLLISEINKHNGLIQKKYNKVRDIPTID
jgi:hypothetical protein